MDLNADAAALLNALEKEFLGRVSPETVILFVGRRPDEQPTSERLKLLEGVNVPRTEARGTITFVLDGEQMRVLLQK